MSKKLAYLNTDKKWYYAVYNNAGDFAKNEGPFATLEEANKSMGAPESTPAGELFTDGEIVVSVDEAKGTDPVTDPEVTPELVEEAKAELIQDGVIPAPVEVTPEVAPEVAPVENTVAPEVAPETPVGATNEVPEATPEVVTDYQPTPEAPAPEVTA